MREALSGLSNSVRPLPLGWCPGSSMQRMRYRMKSRRPVSSPRKSAISNRPTDATAVTPPVHAVAVAPQRRLLRHLPRRSRLRAGRVTWRSEDVGCTVQQLPLPVSDLVRMDLERFHQRVHGHITRYRGRRCFGFVFSRMRTCFPSHCCSLEPVAHEGGKHLSSSSHWPVMWIQLCVRVVHRSQGTSDY